MLLKHEAQTDDVMMLMEKCSSSRLFSVFNGVNGILHVSVTRASLRVQAGPGDTPSSCQVSFQILTLISPTGQSYDVTDWAAPRPAANRNICRLFNYQNILLSENQRKAISHHFMQYQAHRAVVQWGEGHVNY